jgi:SAM-dependent methyltransferase
MDTQKTAEHYSKQWGSDLNFKGFIEANAEAAKVMPARQLPWGELVEKIRAKAQDDIVTVYDAACGYGDILTQLTVDPLPVGLRYVGADIHEALDSIARPPGAKLIQWDITRPLPESQKFDYILCRAAIHHTPDPVATFKTLVEQLRPGGTIAISAYAKKSPMREAVDDALRNLIIPMSNDAAFSTAHQLTALGRDLQAAGGMITITEDLPFLGIKAGVYAPQDFVYRYFIKCWYNSAFSERHCDLVNFDWYHPPYAFRYEREELRTWAIEALLTICREASTDAQHYMQCELR